MGVRIRKLTEKEFMAQVVALAGLCGWKVYHTYDSRRSVAGYPDLTLIRGRVLVVAELKVGRNKLTPEQAAWVAAFEGAGIPAYLWTPDSWDDIEAVLVGGTGTAAGPGGEG